MQRPFDNSLLPEHQTIVVRHAESIAIQGAESEVGVLLLRSPVTELAGGDGVLLWVDDPQPPGGPVLCLLVVIQGLCPHL